MKRNTLLLIGLTFFNLGYSQNPQLEELLVEYQNIPPNGASIQHFFNNEEIALLKEYFSLQSDNTESEQGDANAIIYGPNVNSLELVSFNVNNPSSLSFINNSLDTTDFESCGDIDPLNLNKAYVLTLENGDFYELNITSGVYTFLGVITPPAGEVWNGIEFDPSTNILYGISANFLDSSTVSIIDIENLSSTEIGQTGTSGAISIATDGEGNFYSHDVISNSFYSIDITTGEATFVGDLGFGVNFGQDLEWDADSESLYMTAFNSDNFNAELRIVDTTNGVTQFIGNISTGSDTQISWAGIQNVSTLSTGDFKENNISLFPDPTNTILHINTTIPINTITLYNTLGQKMESHTLNKPLQYNLNIGDISRGIYIIELQTSSGTLTKKFIKR